MGQVHFLPLSFGLCFTHVLQCHGRPDTARYLYTQHNTKRVVTPHLPLKLFQLTYE